jgi:FkbM family methyltransferase
MILERLKSEKRPLRFLLSRLLWQWRICHLFAIQRRGYRLRFNPTAMSASLWVDSEFSAADESFFEALLKPGDMVVDVGANIGALTLCASARVGASGKIFSVEAHPVIFGYLIRNLRFNEFTNVAAYNLAIGNRNGKATCTDRRSDDQNSIATGSEGIEIDLCPLDEVIPGGVRIALLKIDVEGYELFVLQGASGTLDRTDVIYFESWQNHFERYVYTTADVVALLEEKGFSVYQNGPHRLERIDATHSSVRCENLVAIRDAADFVSRTGFTLNDRI